MSYLPLQIIVTLFVAFVVFRLWKRFQEKVLAISELLGWLAIWLLILGVVWLPQTTSYLAFILGVGRGVDLAIYLALVLLFYLNFKMYLRIDKQQQEITKIVRYLSLKDE